MYRPNRRDLLKLTAALPVFTLTGTAKAMISAPDSGQAPGYFRFKMGEARLTVISDGYFTGAAAGLGINVAEADVMAFLEQHRESTVTAYQHTNHVVIELGDAVVLVDVGGGTRFLPTTGRILQNLEAAGIDADAITHVFLTHAHPDHVWGIRDDFDEALFPDAEYIVGGTEYDWWMQDDLVNQVPDSMQQMVLGAVNSLSAVEPQLRMAVDGDEVAPGVTAVASHGHTHGHMSLRVDTGGDSLLVLGDAATHPYVSFEQPDWVREVDMDPAQTVSTRKKLLDMAATDKMAVLGYHFPFPGLGHVMAIDGAYRFLPALWQWDAN